MNIYQDRDKRKNILSAYVSGLLVDPDAKESQGKTIEIKVDLTESEVTSVRTLDFGIYELIGHGDLNNNNYMLSYLHEYAKAIGIVNCDWVALHVMACIGYSEGLGCERQQYNMLHHEWHRVRGHYDSK